MNLSQKIADARAKLHQVQTEGSTVEITTDTGTVKFSKVNAHDLEAYLARLEASAGGRRRRGAIGVRF